MVMSAAAMENGGGGGGPSSGAKKDPTPFYQHGLELLKASRYDEAQAEFRKVLRILPDHAPTHYLMGLSLEGQQDFKEARKEFKTARRNDPKLYEAHLRFGLLSLRLGDRDEASDEVATLEKAKERCAGKCTAEEIAKIQAELDALDAALQGKPAAGKLGALPAGRADGVQHYLAAVELIHGEQFAAAAESLRQSDAAFGPNADVLNYRGFFNRKLGQFEVALAYYAQALQLEPGHRGANEHLGELYLQMGRVDLAIAQPNELAALCSFGCVEEEALRHWIAAAD